MPEQQQNEPTENQSLDDAAGELFNWICEGVQGIVRKELEEYSEDEAIDRLKDADGRRALAFGIGVAVGCWITGRPLAQCDYLRGHGYQTADCKIYEPEFLEGVHGESKEPDGNGR